MLSFYPIPKLCSYLSLYTTTPFLTHRESTRASVLFFGDLLEFWSLAIEKRREKKKKKTTKRGGCRTCAFEDVDMMQEHEASFELLEVTLPGPLLVIKRVYLLPFVS